jgi:hypothetical protein
MSQARSAIRTMTCLTYDNTDLFILNIFNHSLELVPIKVSPGHPIIYVFGIVDRPVFHTITLEYFTLVADRIAFRVHAVITAQSEVYRRDVCQIVLQDTRYSSCRHTSPNNITSTSIARRGHLFCFSGWVTIQSSFRSLPHKRSPLRFDKRGLTTALHCGVVPCASADAALFRCAPKSEIGAAHEYASSANTWSASLLTVDWSLTTTRLSVRSSRLSSGVRLGCQPTRRIDQCRLLRYHRNRQGEGG